ncbi:hypothetical protein [Paenibacillus sp. USHLN196]|uniref:hypothetical protein n=1 Tax=Paenibacillus sp. USHLN196 TaxID=3081291 RepID=UPI003018FB1B
MFQNEYFATVKILHQENGTSVGEVKEVVLNKYPMKGQIVYLNNNFYQITKRVDGLFELKEVEAILGQEVN